jgi:oligoribonuclease
MNHLFVDTETTGLDPKKDALLEVALVVTDADLSILGQVSTLWPQTESSEVLFGKTYKKVQEMHQKNGLWLDLFGQEQTPAGTRPTVCIVQQALLAWLAPFGISPNAKIQAAGRNPGFDVGFLRENAPLIADCFTHQKIDVTAFQYRCTARYGNSAKFSVPDYRHRALEDCLCAIAELRHYEQWMVPA